MKTKIEAITNKRSGEEKCGKMCTKTKGEKEILNKEIKCIFSGDARI